MKQRVLIADHRAAFRESLQALLSISPDFETVAVLADRAELLAHVVQTMPDIVCLAIDMPGLNAIDTTKQLLAVQAEMKIIALSAHADWRVVLAMLDAGAAGYVSRKGGGQALLRAILGVARYKKTYLCPEVASDVLAALRARQAPIDTRPTPLAEAFQHLQQIVAASPVATFAIDRNHVVIYWNKACEILTAMPASEVLGTRQQWRAFYREERPLMADAILDGMLASDLATKLATDLACLSEGAYRKSALLDGSYEIEEFIPGFGDTGRWIFSAAAPLHDRDGRIVGMIETLQDVTERRLAEMALKASEARYRALCITDNLTGLFNSRHFHDQLKAEIGRAIRYGHPLSLIDINVDNFRRFNDTYGHFEGDRMLEKLATVIRNCLRLGDTGYRKGGKEFAVLLPETELDCAQKVAERLRASFAALPFTPWSNLPVYSAVSIGVTCYAHCEDFTDFIRRADAGTASARQQGGNRVVVMPVDIRGDAARDQPKLSV